MIVDSQFFYDLDIGDSAINSRDMKRFELFGDGLRVLAHACVGGWEFSLWCGNRKVCDNPTREQIINLLKALKDE